MTSAPLTLFGRESAIRRLGALIERVNDNGGAVVVRGEPGIGKSALLRVAGDLASARGVRVLRTAGVESETGIAFAGLYQLLRPVLDRVDQLPNSQRGAVLAALGHTDATVSDPFLVALATLNLLSDLAAGMPLLLLVEDAHWIDRASGDVLAFLARRLEFEPIVLIVSMRDGTPTPFVDAGLVDVVLLPLDTSEARALLDARAPDLEPAVRERVLDEAAGNPLALIELPIAMRRLGGAAMSAALAGPWLPMTDRLERAFADRVSELPSATRALLLVAALNDGDSLVETVAAATILDGHGRGLDTLEPAIDARLVELGDDRLVFRHPLVRSAIHQGFNAAQRRSGHAALAQVVPVDFERRVWHRAAATLGPAEDIAAELALAGERLRRRGAIASAMAALERAAELSPDPRRRGERLVRAAEFASDLGRRAAVLDLLRQSESLSLSAVELARTATIRDAFDDGIRDVASGTGRLADLAERVAADGETNLAIRLLLATATRCYFREPGTTVRRQVTAAAERVCRDELDPRLLAIFGFVAPIDRGRVILDRLGQSTHEASPNAARMLGVAALAVGAFDTGVALHSRAIDGLRSQGRLALLARSLGARVWCALHLVDLSVAVPAAEEGIRLARETSQPNIEALGFAHQALIAALRGDADGLGRYAAMAEREGLPVGARPTLAVAQWARGLFALAEGRHADAYVHLRRMHDRADPAYHISHRWSSTGDVVEAAVRSGQRDAIKELMAGLERLARQTPAPVLHIGLRHARALVAEDQDAEALYRIALGADMAGWPFPRARAQLAYGEWLRRQRRAAESRGHLRAARETFDALGLGPWGDRARRELRASGETSRRRDTEPLDVLTPQELQIARLAADGLTNREIGQKLYLSHRTVSTHLHRIFPKLGVTSRGALRAALTSTVESTVI